MLFNHPLQLFTVAFPLLPQDILRRSISLSEERMPSENLLQYHFFAVAHTLLPISCVLDPEVGQTRGYLDFFIHGENTNWAIEFVVSQSETDKNNILSHCARFKEELKYANIAASHQIVVNFCSVACVDICWLQRETDVLIVHCVISPDYSSYELVFSGKPTEYLAKEIDVQRIKLQSGVPLTLSPTGEWIPFLLNQIPYYAKDMPQGIVKDRALLTGASYSQ